MRCRRSGTLPRYVHNVAEPVRARSLDETMPRRTRPSTTHPAPRTRAPGCASVPSSATSKASGSSTSRAYRPGSLTPSTGAALGARGGMGQCPRRGAVRGEKRYDAGHGRSARAYIEPVQRLCSSSICLLGDRIKHLDVGLGSHRQGQAAQGECLFDAEQISHGRRRRAHHSETEARFGGYNLLLQESRKS